MTVQQGLAGVRRVALFAPSMTWGGAEKMFARLGAGFVEHGLSVDLVLASADGPNLEGLHPAIRVVDLKCGRLMSSVRPLARYLNVERPDVVISTLDHANLIAVWARLLARATPQLMLREANTLSVAAKYSSDARDRLLPHMVRAFYPRADVIVAVSRGVADDLIHELGIPARTVRVIYNPTFDNDILTQMQEPLTHPWFADGAPPVILSVGRLSLQKRFDTLIEAISIAVKQRALRLMILGEGEERSNLESLVRDLNLEDTVSLQGFVGNPYPYMARAGLYAVSSAWEGFPNTIVEALACGAPVVSTDCPSGPREILDIAGPGSGRFGTIVPVGDPQALAEGILSELNLNREKDDLKGRARLFSSERATRAYLELMHAGILGSRR